MSSRPGGHGAPHSDAGGGQPAPAVQAVRECLRGRLDVRLALVFGSRARGTATPTSDVDVAVGAPGIDLLELAALLSRATGLEVDVVDFSRPDQIQILELAQPGPEVIAVEHRPDVRVSGFPRQPE